MLKESMGWNVYKINCYSIENGYFNIFPYIPKIVVLFYFEVKKQREETNC